MALQPKDNPGRVDDFSWVRNAEGRGYTLYLHLPDPFGAVSGGTVKFFTSGQAGFFCGSDLRDLVTGLEPFENAETLKNILAEVKNSWISNTQRSIRIGVLKVIMEFTAANPEVIETCVTNVHQNRAALLGNLDVIFENPSTLAPSAGPDLLGNITLLLNHDPRLADAIRKATARDVAVLVKLQSLREETFGEVAGALVEEST